jgi:hypothetical protein
MASIIALTTKPQFGIELFPLADELYCEPVVRLFRGTNTNSKDLLDENTIIKPLEIVEWIRHHLINHQDKYLSATFYGFELQDIVNRTDNMEIICSAEPTYRGDARDFVDQIDRIPAKFSKRILAISSICCYLLPKSVWDELADRGYKVILDELFESRISHLFGFLTWASMVGIDTHMFIILSGRYNAHHGVNLSNIQSQNRDLDFDGMGCKVVNYPAFFWHFTAVSAGVTRNVNWGANNDYQFPRTGLFLNRTQRIHRLLAVAYLQKENVLDDFFWSMIGSSPENLNNLLNTTTNAKTRQLLQVEDWLTDELCETLRCIVPRTLDDDNTDKHRVDDYYFLNSKFSLVTETCGGSNTHWDTTDANYYPNFSPHLGYYDSPNFKLNHRRYGFITEKTYRPIAVGHPFIVAGNNNLLKQLHALGFETFQTYFTEAYDSILEDNKRFSAVMDLAVYLSREGFNERGVKEIVEHNKQHFWSKSVRAHVVNTWFIQPVLDASR